MRRRDLERDLAGLDAFDAPRLDLEQYPTPADLAASLLHAADLRGDLAGRTVVDLGAGTGVLALGAARCGAARTVGVERDPAALAVARANAARLGLADRVAWVGGDATRLPLCPDGPVTVVMNPPFGAQPGREHADRDFLETAADVATVSHSVHNAGSRAFVEAFAADAGGTVTDAHAAVLDLDRRFPHHTASTHELDVEVFRIEWGG